MTTNQLKYFVTAAKCLNFTEAGRQHYISQTAITQHIQALEDQLGVKLFSREKRKVSLTPAGKIFLEEARAILERIRIASERTEKAANGEVGNLNIGYVKGFENNSLGNIIKKYREQYPNIDFGLHRKSHLDLFMLLKNEKLDLIFNFCFPQTDTSDFEMKKLSAQRLYAVLYPSHPYANLSSIRRYDLRNEIFFLTKFYDDKLAQDFDIPDMYIESGFIPKVAGISSDIETIFLLISCGIGISIMPEYIVHSAKQIQDLVFIPLEGENEYIDVAVLWRKDDDNQTLHRFLDLLDSK